MMDPKTILDLGANGVILLGAVTTFIWLFRTFLPESRAQFNTALESAIKTFDQSLQQERELHKFVQLEESESHKLEIVALKDEMIEIKLAARLSHEAMQGEIKAFNTQFSHFMTIFISLHANDAQKVVEFYEKLNGKNS